MAAFSVIFKNTFAQGAGKAAVLVFSFATTALLTRGLGAQGYGTYAFITALVLLFGTISDWGTTIISVREAARAKHARQADIFGSAATFRLLLAGLAVGLLNLAIRLNPAWQKFIVPTTVASFVLLVLSLKMSLSIIFQTKLRLERSALMEIASSAVFLILVGATLGLGGGLVGVMAAWVAATLLATLVGLVLAKNMVAFSPKLDWGVIRRIFWEAAPTGALLLLFSIYNRVDTIILQHFQGETAVGLYGLAYKIHDNLVLGAAFLMNATFPVLVRQFARRDRRAGLGKYYQKIFDVLLLGAILVAGATFLAAPVAITVLGGSQFLPSVGILRVLVLATFLSYFNHLTGYSLIAAGRQRVSLAIAAFVLVFNLVANWIFIPLYSYRAAAVITVATESLVLLLSSMAVFRATGLFPRLANFPQTWLTIIKTKGRQF